MALRKPEERQTIDQVLKLVKGLSSQGREELLNQLKLEQLRRDIQEGIDASERGELFSEEEVMAEMKKHHAELKKAGRH